jgi:predicted DNA-binding protein (UPF0251 family)
MAYQDFKVQVLNAAFQLAGTILSQTMQDGKSAYEQLSDDYYKKSKSIIEKSKDTDAIIIEKKEKIQYKEREEPEQPEIPDKDITTENIEKGVACILCSVDHISTASGALNEALRFAREKGITYDEAQSRISIANDELNIMERIDLNSKKIAGMVGEEKKVALDALNFSRDLRHKIKSIHSTEELEKVSAYALDASKEIMKLASKIPVDEGNASILCNNLTGAEKERCLADINSVIEEKNKV